MYYTVYKITNLIDNKIYIGVHITSNLNDDYMGSGKILIRSVKKYGIQNFKKEILFIFDSPKDMFEKESEIVNEEFVKRPDTYNIKCGGHGGWDYVNILGLNYTVEKNNRITGFKNVDPEVRKQWIEITKYKIKQNWTDIRNGLKVDRHPNRRTFLGKKHTDETKEKMSRTKKSIGYGIGEKNSQFGTCWITNGIDNKKIKITDIDLYTKDGWKKGRNIK